MPVEEQPIIWPDVIENAIVERLKLFLPGFAVSPMPDKEWRFTHARGDVLVGFVGIDPDPPKSTSTPIQDADLTYEVVLRARSLKDRSGLYAMVVQALGGLLGWKPPLTKPLELSRGQNAGYDDGVWRFLLVFKTSFILIPLLDPPTEVPPLMKIFELKRCPEDCQCQT